VPTPAADDVLRCHRPGAMLRQRRSFDSGALVVAAGSPSVPSGLRTAAGLSTPGSEAGRAVDGLADQAGVPVVPCVGDHPPRRSWAVDLGALGGGALGGLAPPSLLICP